jgi:secreted trypsin-like serine protease
MNMHRHACTSLLKWANLPALLCLLTAPAFAQQAAAPTGPAFSPKKVRAELGKAMKAATTGKTVEEKLTILATELRQGELGKAGRLPIGFSQFKAAVGPPIRELPNSIYTDPVYMANAAKIIGDGVTGRVFGTDALPTGNYPECVAVGRLSTYFASGVVIDKDLILTAAHICANDSGSMPNRVWYGPVTPNNQDREDADGVKLKVSRYYRHQDYRHGDKYGSPLGNDLLLLEIHPDDREKITAKTTLATAAEAVGFGQDPLISVRVVGFGHSRIGLNNEPQGFGIRREVSIPLASRDVNRYGLFELDLGGMTYISEFVGASTNERADTCKGDSGGPVYITVGPPENRVTKLIGITSRRAPGDGPVCGVGAVYEYLPLYQEWIATAYANRESWEKVQ